MRGRIKQKGKKKIVVEIHGTPLFYMNQIVTHFCQDEPDIHSLSHGLIFAATKPFQ
jgi:hypothetical protein